MASGKYVDLGNLTVDDIDIKDIEVSLNQILRFTGHSKDAKPLTVAQHTLLVMEVCTYLFPRDQEAYIQCLMHDWGEAYYGDVSTPLKKMFPEMRKYMNHVDDLIHQKYYPKPSEEVEARVKICDLLALDIERRVLWKDQRGKDLWPNIPYESTFTLEAKRDLFDWVRSSDYIGLEKDFTALTNG